MKNIPSVIISPVIFFVILFVYTKIAGPLPLSISSVVTQKTDVFSVSGTGKATIIPDLATVSIGVQARGSTTKQVQDEMNKKINSVSRAIENLGIDKKDIQTANYSIYPNYDYKNSTQRITGYQANTNLTIKVRELDKANAVLDQTTAEGANIVGGITFDVSDKTKPENEARQKAFQEARQKAEIAAQIAGFKLGRVINYAENNDGQVAPRPMFAKAEGGADLSTPTQIQPGSQEIAITVTISYEIQ